MWNGTLAPEKFFAESKSAFALQPAAAFPFYRHSFRYAWDAIQSSVAFDLLRGESVTFEGQVFRTHQAKLSFASPCAAPPVYLGVLGPKNLEMAGQIADGVLLSVMTSAAYARFAIDHVRRGAERAGRRLSDLEIGAFALTEPGSESPFRSRAVEENRDLLRRMRKGEFPNGARVLRAKIDMASGNINLRDPVLYRILHATHPRTGDAWSIYPSYDYAHGQSDAIEGITHSICTLEFEDHRPLYEWLLDKLPVPSKPRQYEFARLNLTYTLLSKRVLTELVRGGHVAGWDDPRMPTIAGLKRRGVPPAAVREFVKRIGVAKANSVVDVGMLEFCIRELLNKSALRRMAVLRPLKVVIENYPEGQSEEIEAVNHPDDATAGTRRIAFGREIYIERDDFMENPPKKFFRLSPGTEVRLRYAYFIRCTDVIKDAAGEVVELRCTYDPATRGGNAPDGRKVKATMHWLPARQSRPAEIRIYNQLFANPSPDAGNFAADLNPQSLEVLSDARVEIAVAETNSNEVMQFERQGYFVRDPDFTPDRPVFNRTIGLRESSKH
jgi:glutaminyl-tRNA synthetase